MATNVEVYWPDGRSIARPLEPSEINSVLEIPYPKDEEEVTPTVEIEVQNTTLTPQYYTATWLKLISFFASTVFAEGNAAQFKLALCCF